MPRKKDRFLSGLRMQWEGDGFLRLQPQHANVWTSLSFVASRTEVGTESPEQVKTPPLNIYLSKYYWFNKVPESDSE